MRELLLVSFGEIYLKGLNRPFFIRKLVERVKDVVKPFNGDVWVHDSRVFVSGASDIDKAIEKICKVFGVHSVSRAIEMSKDNIDDICVQACKMLENKSGTFKVNARRADKRYPLNSPKINGYIGEKVLENIPALKVDVKKPDVVLSVEIRDKAYLYCDKIPAAGGMPIGTNGRATLLLSGGIDSPVAGWMVAKRGVIIDAVHYHSFPYTSERALDKVLKLASIMSEYTCGMRVHVVPFTDIQMNIHEKCHKDYTTLIMRRYMMRIAEQIAIKEGSMGLVTGESIGQVASQTMQAMQCTDSVVGMPVYRPLIGFDKQEIVDIAQKIDTYETSALPFEDCCTVFTPKHPVTRPKSDKVLEVESAYDAFEDMQKAIENREIIKINQFGERI